MFEFKYVELMNWAYWPTVKLPMDESTIMITGPNGSGKTTFLDALRVLLRAPRLSSGRRFQDYLVNDIDTAVIKAVVSNDFESRERRPFEFKGFNEDQVTLAGLMFKRSGRWERRFLILEGDVPLEALRKMPKSHMMTPESYTYEISQAGFGAAFLKVLALEQGKTDKLCEKSPRALLDLLLEVHGDKKIIDRYKQARENYHAANMDLSQLGARLTEEQAKVMASERAAKQYQRYIQLVGEQKTFETVLLPQAEYVEADERIKELKLEIEEHNSSLGPIDREILKVQEQLDNADSELERRRREVETAREQKIQFDKRERGLDIKLNQFVEERRKLEKILEAAKSMGDDIDLDKLFEKRSKLRREIVRLELQEEDIQRKLDNMQQDVLGLDVQRRKVYPRYVDDFTRALGHAGIQFDLLCDVIDIKEQDWQLAIESILGRDRFTVIVDEKDQLQARKLGQQNRYRCYVVANEPDAQANLGSATKDSAATMVDLLIEGIPRWITDNLKRTVLVEDVEDGMRMGGKTVSVTRKGYRQDSRGGVSIAVDRFYCGSLGQSSLKDDLQKEMNDLKSELGSIRKSLTAKRDEEQSLQEAIHLQENVDRIQEAHARMKQLVVEIPDLNTEHKMALELRTQSEHKLIDSLEALSNFERDCGDMSKELVRKRGNQSGHLGELQELQDQVTKLTEQMRSIASKLTEEQVSERALRKVEELDELTPKYYTVKRLLVEFETIPEEGAVEVYDHHKLQYDQQRAIYEQHEIALKKWENEFKMARAKYVIVVDHTIREYRSNVLTLSEVAGIAAEITLPDLKTMESSLDDAELSIRFGFDGKKVANMGASSLSGGQRVVASLVLLMSLATSGGINRGGFFIIDEPFAHLSLERIDDVTQFLTKSHCQFILTSPTTHNVNVFSAAKIQMNFRIKRRGEKFAPVPTVITR